jgi:WD40 repeat protein
VIDAATGHVDGDVVLGSRDFPVDPAWSPDGQRLALGTNGGTLTVLDAATLRPVAERIPAASGFVDTVAFSPDGSTIVTGGSDAEFSLWDAATGARIGSPVSTGDNQTFTWFDRRGDIVGDAAGVGDPVQHLFRFPGRPGEWLAAACATAGGDLSRAEWARYVTDRPYRTRCG